MRTKILFSILFMLLLIGSVSAYTITDNTEDAFSYLGDPLNPGKAVDESFGSFSNNRFILEGQDNLFYINYTKPSDTVSAVSEFKYELAGGTGVIDVLCYDSSGYSMENRLFQDTSAGMSNVNHSIPPSCLESEVLSLRVQLKTTQSELARIYEEQIHWEIGETQESCDYIVGDSDFALPQITTDLVYDDSPDHKMYLACLYESVDGVSGYEEMIGTQNCRGSVEIFSPSSPGDYSYTLAVVYQERQWNQSEHAWQTVSGGTDVSLDHEFTVCEIPDDTEGRELFLGWISNLLCDWFGWFC